MMLEIYDMLLISDLWTRLILCRLTKLSSKIVNISRGDHEKKFNKIK